ncbi:unnamed protein product [Arctogadus glacialis]
MIKSTGKKAIKKIRKCIPCEASVIVRLLCSSNSSQNDECTVCKKPSKETRDSDVETNLQTLTVMLQHSPCLALHKLYFYLVVTLTGVIRPCLNDQQDKMTNPVVEEAPSDISRSRVDAPVQPQLKDFPRTTFGDRRRNFNASCMQPIFSIGDTPRTTIDRCLRQPPEKSMKAETQTN